MLPRLLPVLLLMSAATLQAQEPPAWVGPMREAHARFTGKPGRFAQFGDSITVTMAYWAPLQYDLKNLSPTAKSALQAVNGHMQRECWRWKGSQYGNDGGQTIRWAHEHIDQWLRELNPEAAMIMFGTNDLGQLDAEEYDHRTREVVQKCLKNGTVVILSTIPPRHGQLEKCKKFADITRKIAADLKVPLVDYQAEILKRRPDDWDGATVHKGARDVYDVTTLISADGVHPSAPEKYTGDFSEEALRASGYNLRSHSTLLAYARVIQDVLAPHK